MSGKKKRPVRFPRAALGIRAQELRTLQRRAWWARRWLQLVEGLNLGPRLGRGRQYAMTGQVTALAAEGRRVTARVVGSRSEPYEVRVDFTPAPEGVAARIAANPMLAARALAGDLPLEIEEAFAAGGGSLFSLERTWCSCPDWHKPCKHVAAVLFLLGEFFARHPDFLVLLHGVETAFGDASGILTGSSKVRPGKPAFAANAAAVEWGNYAPLPAGVPAPLPIRLGPIPFWRGYRKCSEDLARVYARVCAASER